jgi:hypothetical protein
MPTFRSIAFHTGHFTTTILTLCFSLEQISHRPLQHIGRTVSRWNISAHSNDMRCLSKNKNKLAVRCKTRERSIHLRGGCSENGITPSAAEPAPDENQQLSANGLFRLCVRRMDSQAGRESDHRLVVSGIATMN